jgi:uncharacterized protein (DUF2132 family)
MGERQPGNPLHGRTLEQVLNSLVEHYGWDELGRRINIRCFTSDPSVPSSLKFLRKTPWARKKVEDLYIIMTRTRARAKP